jgi:hypothetical protein
LSEKDNLDGVILVSFEYPPRSLSFISSHVALLADYLVKNDIPCWVITFDDWRCDKELSKAGAIVHRIPRFVSSNISEFAMIMNLKASYQMAIAEKVNEYPVDIIHCFNWFCLPPIIPWKHKMNQKTVYSLSHLIADSKSGSSPYQQGIQKIEELGIQSVDLIITPKQLQKSVVNQYPVVENKVKEVDYSKRALLSEIVNDYKQLVRKGKNKSNG